MDNHRQIKMAVAAVSPNFKETLHILGRSADMLHTASQFYQENAVETVDVETSQLLGRMFGHLANIGDAAKIMEKEQLTLEHLVESHSALFDAFVGNV